MFVSRRTIGGSGRDFAAAVRRAAQEAPISSSSPGSSLNRRCSQPSWRRGAGGWPIVGVVAIYQRTRCACCVTFELHVRRAMAASLRAAIGYRSLRRIGGGRTCPRSRMLCWRPVRCAGHREGANSHGLARMQRDGASGMRSVDESLARAVARRQVALREAAAHAIDRRPTVSLVPRTGQSNTSTRQNNAADCLACARTSETISLRSIA